MATRGRKRAAPIRIPVMLDVPTASSFKHVDGLAIAKLSGVAANIHEAIEAIARILASAAESGVGRLVIDGTGVQGLRPPSLADRHATVRAWAAAADGRVVMALACSPALMDTERFGIIAAANFGLRTNVFASVHDAMAWLALQ